MNRLAAPDNALTIAIGGVTCYLPLSGLVDLDQERQRLAKEIANADQEIGRLTNLLASPFAQKAPANVVDKEREKLAKFQASRAELQERIDSL